MSRSDYRSYYLRDVALFALKMAEVHEMKMNPLETGLGKEGNKFSKGPLERDAALLANFILAQ